jgi:hypothetical protein
LRSIGNCRLPRIFMGCSHGKQVSRKRNNSTKVMSRFSVSRLDECFLSPST